jgi:hypothetical protein
MAWRGAFGVQMTIITLRRLSAYTNDYILGDRACASSVTLMWVRVNASPT